jgi:uncharacterized protein
MWSTKPKQSHPGTAYLAPTASAGNEEGVLFGQDSRLWSQPVPPGGAAVWTTPALGHDLEVLGPASADIWLRSTGTDTDLQVTVTEVRPDGQETYVARGWLRASHRALDHSRSTGTYPVQTHLQGDSAPVKPGVPTLMRVEVFPFNHVFRAGSSLRLIVDTPSQTGGWGFKVLPTPVTNTVLHDTKHPSRLVLGVLSGARAKNALARCGTLLNQPCRPDPYSVPPGRLTLH